MQGGVDDYLPSEDACGLWTCCFCNVECASSATVPSFAAVMAVDDGAGAPLLISMHSADVTLCSHGAHQEQMYTAVLPCAQQAAG